MDKTLQKTSVRCLLALLCCALWGSAFPSIKIGYEWLDIKTAGSQILFAGYRFFLSGVMVFIMACIFEKKIITVQRRAAPHVLSLGFFQTTVQYVFFYIGMANVTGTKGSIINASGSLVSIIIAHFVLKDERMNLKKALGCLLGLVGIILINLNGIGGSFTFSGEGMIIICTIAYGACSVYTKVVSHLISPMALTAYQFLFGGAMLIVIGFVLGGHIDSFDVKSIMLLLYMAGLSAVGLVIWTALIKYNPVGKITIFCCSIPIFGVVMSAVILGEPFWSIRNLCALLCVSIGIMIVNSHTKNTSDAPV